MQQQEIPAMRLAIISGGMSKPSSTLELGRMIREGAADQLCRTVCPAEMVEIEIGEIAEQVVTKMLGGETGDKLQKAFDGVAAAHGLIVVSPVFQGSFSGLLKSFFDLLPPGSLAGKAVALGATGGSVRHSLVIESALRPLISYLHGTTVSTGVYAAKSEWLQNPDEIVKRAHLCGTELARWMQLLQGRSPEIAATAQ